MIFFVSDIHLGSGGAEKSTEVERKFVDWLRSISSSAEHVFILGDMFDFWFEYNHVVPKGFVRTLGELARMTDNGIKVTVITGNHDMWMYDYLRDECGVEIFHTPQTYTISGRRLYLSHGDNTNISGKPLLQLMNRCFRSRTLKFLFSWLVHPDIAMRFGKWWSGSSRKAHGKETDVRYLNPLIEYAALYSGLEHVDTFIFGHMHIIHHTITPVDAYFLGEWHSTPNFLQMDSDGRIEAKTL